MTARTGARYVLEVPQFVGDEPDPRAALDAVFDLLEHGLPTTSEAQVSLAMILPTDS
ncbi:MAG: hypothetical protein ACRDQA_10910 [Nocardioidaceae bacterium]